MADVTLALTGASSVTGRGSVTPSRAVGISSPRVLGVAGNAGRSVGPFQGLTLVPPTVALSLTGITGIAGTLALPVPPPTLALRATTPIPAQLTLSLPAPVLAMSALTGNTGALVLPVPLVSIRLGGNDGLTLRVPLPDLALAGVSGQTAIFAPRVAMPTLAMSATTNALATLSLQAPLPTLKLVAGQGITGNLLLAAPLPNVLLGAVTGQVGDLRLSAPVPTLQFTGGFAAVGTLALAVPLPVALMQGFTASPVPTVGVSTTYALQTERMALSHYTNFPFNSFATFQGKLLGATGSGIFELTGDTDAGLQIDAEIRTGITDMNTSRIKRVDRVYIGYRGLKGYQTLILRVLTNETQQRDYGVGASINTMLHGTRTRLGLGVESRYWQFGLLNREGRDFTIDSIEVAPIPYNRRRGSKDA